MLTGATVMVQRSGASVATEPGGGHQCAAQADVGPVLESMLRELPRQQRAALVLRYLLDLPDNQIADHLNCSPATVRSHVSQALATLRIVAAQTARYGS